MGNFLAAINQKFYDEKIITWSQKWALVIEQNAKIYIIILLLIYYLYLSLFLTQKKKKDFLLHGEEPEFTDCLITSLM